MVQGSSVSIVSGYDLGIRGSITCRNGHFCEALEHTHRLIHWVPATVRISVTWAWNLPFGFIVGQTTLMSSPGYCLTPTVAVQQWDSAFCIQDVPVGSQSTGTLSWTSQGNDGSAPTLKPRQHESFGHVACIWGGINAYKILMEEPDVEGRLWRPSCRWQDDIKIDLNPLAYTDVPETAGLARSFNP